MKTKLKIIMIVCLSMMVIPSISYAQAAPPPGEYAYYEIADDFTDEKSYELWYASTEFGEYSRTVLFNIYCDRNRTGVFITGGGYVFKKPLSGSVKTAYRVDLSPASTVNIGQSYKGGLIQGADAIAFIKTIMNNNTLKLGIETSSGRKTHTFNVRYMFEHIEPLRKNCGW